MSPHVTPGWSSGRCHLLFATCLILAFFLIPAASAFGLGKITVFKTGPGAGESSVTSNPVGIECGAECEHEFGAGGAVELTASPGPGLAFAGWGGVECPQGEHSLLCTLNTGVAGTSFNATATFVPRPPLPTASSGTPRFVGETGATMVGAVDPEGTKLIGCTFEYGTTTGYGATAPCAPDASVVGEGMTPVSVTAVTEPLEAGVTYHYRVSASNIAGAAHGQDQEFTTTGTAACPNAARRLEQGILAILLPECRAYELVSKGDNQGIQVAGLQALLPTGGRTLFSSQIFGEPASAPGISNPYVAVRTSDGWTVASMGAPVGRSGYYESGFWWPAASLSSVLWDAASAPELTKTEGRWELTNLDGSTVTASPQLRPVLATGTSLSSYLAMGGSNDFSHIIFKWETNARAISLLEGESLVAPGRGNLYGISDALSASPVLGLVNREGIGGPQIGGVCGAYLGGYNNGLGAVASHAVSEDGSVVYFSARPATASSGACGTTFPVRLFKREDEERTLEVSESQCTRVESPGPPVVPACGKTSSGATVPNGDDTYQGASVDGSIVAFTTPRQLTNSDEDATADLYVYDADPPAGEPQLVQASAGEVAPGHPEPGVGAEVLGVLDVSASGSRVYFVAKGVLAGENAQHEAPIAGEPNLYLFERSDAVPAGRVKFIATLAAGDSALWGTTSEKKAYALPVSEVHAGARVPGGGDFLVFTSLASLPVTEGASDSNSAADVYRYDASNGALVCVSCEGHLGGNPALIVPRPTLRDAVDSASAGAIASEDVSTIVFTTIERLRPVDDNATEDAYLWHDGELRDLTGSAGTVGGAPSESAPTLINASGSEVDFLTEASLTSEDSDGGAKDVYTARVDGGFTQPNAPGVCGDVEACHGSPSISQPPPPAASGAVSGSVNQLVPAPKCAPRQVRRHGRCVKRQRRPHHKNHRTHRRHGVNREQKEKKQNAPHPHSAAKRGLSDVNRGGSR